MTHAHALVGLLVQEIDNKGDAYAQGGTHQDVGGEVHAQVHPRITGANGPEDGADSDARTPI